MRHALALAAFLSLAAGSPARAAESDIANLTLGRHVTGPQIAPSALKGKVVLAEMWGTK